MNKKQKKENYKHEISYKQSLSNPRKMAILVKRSNVMVTGRQKFQEIAE